MDWMDFVMERLVLPVIIILTVLVLFVGLPALCYSMYKQSKSPTFELHKNEWSCTEEHTETYTTYVQSGKVMIPIINTSHVCDQWSRTQ